jgi:Protein of unknown function (DUF3592)
MVELLLPGIFMVVALVLIFTAAYQRVKVAAARRWPVAEGIVLESRVDRYRAGRGGWRYRPVITYQYRVGERVYTNNLLAFGAHALSEGGDAAQQRAHVTVARYPVGGQTAVHYNPRCPSRSVLEVRSVVAKALLIVGVIILLAAVLLAAAFLVADAVMPRPTPNR